MEKQITIRGIDNKDAQHSESIRNYINDHLSKAEMLLSHVGTPVNIDVAVEVVKPHPDHQVTMHIRAPHFNVVVKKEGSELYKVIDLVMDVTVQQLVDHKERVIDKRDHRR